MRIHTYHGSKYKYDVLISTTAAVKYPCVIALYAHLQQTRHGQSVHLERNRSFAHS